MRFHILDEEQIGRHLASPNTSDDMVLKTTADASERIEINNGATTIFIRLTARRCRAKLISHGAGCALRSTSRVAAIRSLPALAKNGNCAVKGLHLSVMSRRYSRRLFRRVRICRP